MDKKEIKKDKTKKSKQNILEQKAVAIGYKPDIDSAPKVLAKGQGFIAEKIIKIAKESGVKIYEDAALAETLNAVEIGKKIPEELYKVVAEVLAFIYFLDRNIKEEYSRI